jgi:hypothetical protein
MREMIFVLTLLCEAAESPARAAPMPNTANLVWVFTAILLPIIPALILYKLLPSTADVQGPFHGLQIKLGGAFAGYFLLVMVVYFWPREKPPELTQTTYEVWTVKGQIQNDDGTTLQQINLSIQPRGVDYVPQDGSFEMDILVRRGQSGEEKFPSLLIEREPPVAFSNAVMHLDPLDKKYIANTRSRVISIKDPIKLKNVQEKPYSPPQETFPTPPTMAPNRK